MCLLLAAMIGLCAAGCTTGARKGAAQGGAMGLVGGMVAGAVDSLLFGGNVSEGAARGGIVSAAGGAAAGAMAGGMAEKNAKSAAQPAKAVNEDAAKLRKKYGDLNFQAAIQLVQCQHQQAIATAQRSLESESKKERKLFAMLIQAIARVETGKSEEAEQLYAQVKEIDPARAVDQSRADTLQALLKVQGIRKDNGLPPCGG